jgi:YHS domain-containing protein
VTERKLTPRRVAGNSDSGHPIIGQCRVCLKEMHAFERRSTVHYRGAHYVVCCPSCAAKFNASPQEYVGAALN